MYYTHSFYKNPFTLSVQSFFVSEPQEAIETVVNLDIRSRSHRRPVIVISKVRSPFELGRHSESKVFFFVLLPEQSSFYMTGKPCLSLQTPQPTNNPKRRLRWTRHSLLRTPFKSGTLIPKLWENLSHSNWCCGEIGGPSIKGMVNTPGPIDRYIRLVLLVSSSKKSIRTRKVRS